MISFHPIASSSRGCAYVVRDCVAPPLLIECGIPFGQLQKALDYQVSTLAMCLVSHRHGDHYNEATARELIKRGVSVSSGDISHVGQWQIKSFCVPHDTETRGFFVRCGDESLVYLTDCPYSPYTFPPMTLFAIECNHSRQLMRANTISGDIAAERYKRTVQNHMSLDRCIDTLKANDLSQCREIHLLHLSDINSSEQEFKDAVQRATGIATYVAPA